MASLVRFLRRVKTVVFDVIYFVVPKRLLALKVRKTDDQWLFIIGCNNSGTTLIKTIIESHPNVIGIEGEGQYRTEQFVTDRDIQLNRLFSERLDVFRHVDNVDPLKVRYDWLVSLSRRISTNHKYILEKTTVNAVRIPWLIKNFPKARFIVIFRNAYAVVEGMRRKEGIAIERAARHWEKTNSLVLNDVGDFQNVLYIKYEDLTQNPGDKISGIWEFLSLPQPSVCVERNNYVIHGNKSRIVNQNPKSLERLTDDELSIISRITSETQLRINELFPES